MAILVSTLGRKSDSSCCHEQELPPLAHRRDAAASGLGAGLRWQGSFGAAGGEPGSGAALAGGDQRELLWREGSAAVRSGDDDGAAVVQLLQRRLLVATDRQGVSGADRLPDDRCSGSARLPDGERVPAAAFGGAVGVVHPGLAAVRDGWAGEARARGARRDEEDRKSTRLNSSHSQISYAVFCLKKK